MKKSELSKNSIVVGCNYHTTWQAHPGMRFVLKSVQGDTAILITRRSKKTITTHVDSLIFIMTDYNKSKAIDLIRERTKGDIKS